MDHRTQQPIFSVSFQTIIAMLLQQKSLENNGYYVHYILTFCSVFGGYLKDFVCSFHFI